MAIKILWQRKMCDGYDVRVDVDGVHQTLHMAMAPNLSTTAAVDKAVADYVAAKPVETWEIEGEDEIIAQDEKR